MRDESCATTRSSSDESRVFDGTLVEDGAPATPLVIPPKANLRRNRSHGQAGASPSGRLVHLV